MNTRNFILTALIALSVSLGFQSASYSQGLIWSLPEDGTWVRYEGDYQQLIYRPDSTDGDLKLSWLRHLEIRSVGKVIEKFQEKDTPCRWVEFETTTGKEEAGQVKPGPGGHRIYKVLIPEDSLPMILDSGEQPALEFLPIVRGYRKIGDQEPQKLDSGVLQVYPTISLLRHSRSWNSASETTDQDTPAGQFQAVERKSDLTLESPTSRSVNKTQLWTSKTAPFGPVKWTVTIARESKDSNQDREEFKRESEITITMTANETGDRAQSKIAQD